MPVEFVGLIELQDWNFLAGLAGIISAFVILTIWSRGL
jgi:hypothetical protein